VIPTDQRKEKTMTRTYSRATSLGRYLPICAVALTALANVPSVGAHPHDLLAQCQLKDGSWKMCSETVHDLKGNHVPKPAAAGSGDLTTAPKTRTQTRQ
jgi:hypothetical protein